MESPSRQVGTTSFWHAPLVLPAVAATAGIVLDRSWDVDGRIYVGWGAAALVGWLGAIRSKRIDRGLIFLALLMMALGGAYHHVVDRRIASNDVGRFAEAEPRSVWLRGAIDGEPRYLPEDRTLLLSLPRGEMTRFEMRVHQLRQGPDWHRVSGRVQVSVPEKLESLHVGDRVEVVGRLSKPESPGNPGEFDFGRVLRDQGIGAILQSPRSGEALVLLERAWPGSLRGWLGAIRGWCQETLQRYVPEQERVARALLLGDGSAMTSDDWEKYMRTGVLHVLAISGQHLVVLAWFLGVMLQTGGLRRRSRALVIVTLLMGYALLTGGRPPVMRAAWGVSAYCLAMMLRRPVAPANVLALAWVMIIVVNPRQVFDVGCQLSFLAVFVLIWGPRPPWLTDDPLDDVDRESRPSVWNLVRTSVCGIGAFYWINAMVWLAITPLAAARYHTLTPISLLIGPPMVLFGSVALVSGFLLLVSAALLPPMAPLFAWPTLAGLWLCEKTVDVGQWLQGGWYVADIAPWLLWVFYGGLLIALSTELGRTRRLWFAGGLVGWTLLVCVLQLRGNTDAAFRCTFLAVGHGGCTVLENSEGHILLYDAGALGGPNVTRRIIGPFLWRRGIRRIDQVVLSHADLDHFNGVPALLERFAVGKVITTPTFAERETPAARLAMASIARQGVAVEQVSAGMSWQLGDVSLEVLHPPLEGLAGNENARSLVLRVRQGGLKILLTGDLEGAGLERLLKLPGAPMDVVMAPHHGGKKSNTKAFAEWAQPGVVVSCQRRPASASGVEAVYQELGAEYLGTWPHGAVTIRKIHESWWAETFRSKQKHRISRAEPSPPAPR